jgi:Xaa-Pro dipeptidase
MFDDWGFSAINPLPLVDRLHFERAWKTEYEIECMREANRRGARGHIAAEAAFRDGASEFEIHLQFLRATSQTESELPYGNVVATNRNGSVLHYQHLERDPHERSRRLSFLIDAGATVNGYASDITRTYSGGDRDFEAMIAALDLRQQQLCAMVRPGLDYRGLHFAAHGKIGEILHEFGLVRCNSEEAVGKGVTRGFFPHGVGHFIGLQVHDVGGCLANANGETIARPAGHPHLRLTRVIEEHQSFTVEPGLYFIDTLLDEMRGDERSALIDWEAVARFRPFGGIRIEDDIAVMADGAENLTRDAFREVTAADAGNDPLPSPRGRRWPRERPDEGPTPGISTPN